MKDSFLSTRFAEPTNRIDRAARRPSSTYLYSVWTGLSKATRHQPRDRLARPREPINGMMQANGLSEHGSSSVIRPLLGGLPLYTRHAR